MTVETDTDARTRSLPWWCAHACVVGVLACLLLAGCGGSAPRRAPTQRDVARILAAMSDIVYQCQSVAAGYVSSADEFSLRRDVDVLLGAYRQVRADAPFVIATTNGQGEHTTLRKQLALAEGNLTDGGCSPAQARRIAPSIGS